MHGRHTMVEGEKRFCALSWTEELRRPAHRRAGRGAPRAHEPLLAHVAGRRHLSRPSLALSPAALGARAEGADVHAHRRAGRGADHLAAGDPGAASATGTTATAGCATRPSRCGRCTRSGSTGRPTTSSSTSPTCGRNKDGSLQIMYGIRGQKDARGVDARSPQGLRGRAAGAHRQRRLQPAPERRLRRGARLGLPARQAARPHPRAPVAGARRPGPLRGEGVAGARPGDLGGARRAAPLRLLEADVLGRAGPRRAPGRTARRARTGRSSGRRWPTRSAQDILERGVDERGVFRQHYDTDALDASTLLVPLRALPAGRRRARARDGDRDPRRAHRGRPGAALPHRGDRRRPAAARRARS